MGMRTRLRGRWAVFLIVVLATSAVAILTPTLSNDVEHDVQVNGKAITLTVEGIPETVAPGDLVRVVATMEIIAFRPIPAVLRFEARNPNSTTPVDLTVYAGCGAEEVVSSRTLRYYIGWHGPLLAAKGVNFPAGTSVATIEAAIGDADYWPVVLHEIQVRDPAGYASLITPGANASAGVGASGSAVLQILAYYGMVAPTTAGSSNPADWTLTMAFSDHGVASGDGSLDGFLIEVHPQSRGSFEFHFWAERPDGLGLPSHPTYACGPL